MKTKAAWLRLEKKTIPDYKKYEKNSGLSIQSLILKSAIPQKNFALLELKTAVGSSVEANRRNICYLLPVSSAIEELAT